jgi:hypothetical protein
MKNIFALLIITILFFSCGQDQGELQNTLNGSYARLLTIGNYLYAINNEELTTFDISNTSDPIELNKQNVGFSIENIYHQAGVLFIGSSEALHIFEIGTDGIPLRKSESRYFKAPNICPKDPVIARENIAYVTLSTVELQAGQCFRDLIINELRIFDISDLENPLLLSSIDMKIPKGLALDGNYLFVCEKELGLKVLDVSDNLNPKVINELLEFKSYDVIAKDGLLMIVCPTEIRQYNYSDINNIILLSSLNL